MPTSEARAGRAALLARLAACGPFGFGASALGNLYREVGDAEARAAVDSAWYAGIRHFDTAPFYGAGLSERRLGDSLRERDPNDYLLSTKAGRLLFPAEPGDRDGFRSPMPFSPVFDYSYDGVMRSFEASLNRLGLARIDILYLHDLGSATHGANHRYMLQQAVDGGFRALTALREQGAVSAIGLGVNEIEICAESMAYTDFDLFLIAGRFTLLDQSAAPFFETCHQRGIGVVAAGVFSSGILAAGAGGPDAFHDYGPASEAIRTRVAALDRLCREFEVPLPAAALRFAASHPAVTLPIVGVRDATQVEAAIGFSRVPIPAELWEALRREGLIAPGDSTNS
ncbi:aldo/keto reductase [Sphingomonas sp. ZT3P38]|uniref:aldo/keto reductase n=1 Tax=Parasphingomonas zepuensis TaxID=3096161 RepID=UPI002FC6A5B1